MVLARFFLRSNVLKGCLGDIVEVTIRLRLLRVRTKCCVLVRCCIAVLQIASRESFLNLETLLCKLFRWTWYLLSINQIGFPCMIEQSWMCFVVFVAYKLCKR